MLNMKPGLFSPFVASVFVLSVIRLSSTIDSHFENLYKPKLHNIQFLIDLLRSDFSSIKLTLFSSLISFTFCFRLFPLCIFRAQQAPMSTYVTLPTQLFTTSFTVAWWLFFFFYHVLLSYYSPPTHFLPHHRFHPTQIPIQTQYCCHGHLLYFAVPNHNFHHHFLPYSIHTSLSQSALLNRYRFYCFQ